MPYCPKCGYEYRDDIESCPDCEVDLVAEPPAEIPEEYQDAEWVELHSFSGPMYARMAIEMLQKEEIPAYTQTQFFGSAFGVGGAGYVGGATPVFVLEPDLGRAEQIIEPIIEELNGLEYGDDEEVDEINE